MLRIYHIPPIILQFIIRIITRILFISFARLSVHGTEHVLKADGPLIFAANHSSEWDGPLIRSCLPMVWRGAPMYYVSMVKEKYTDSGWRKLIYGGVLFNLLGAYPVYSGKKDYAYSLQNHIAILKQGRSVCIFPEGARTKDGSLGQPRGGVAYLAFAAQARVIPVSVTELACLNLKDFVLRRRHVTVTFHEPIDSSSLFKNPTKAPTVDEIKSAAEHIFTVVRLDIERHNAHNHTSNHTVTSH